MENAFDTMAAAVREARAVETAANEHANAMAQIVAGRLRHVRPWVLKQIKKELREFNIHTGEWKP